MTLSLVGRLTPVPSRAPIVARPADFTALRSLAVLALAAGLLNVPNLQYFAGEEYSAGQEGAGALRGSAVCTVQEFVPCPTCGEWTDARGQGARPAEERTRKGGPPRSVGARSPRETECLFSWFGGRKKS